MPSLIQLKNEYPGVVFQAIKTRAEVVILEAISFIKIWIISE